VSAGRPARKTKIVCTIGPATAAEDRLRALLRAGMEVARLNFSHGTRAEHGEVIDRLRRLADEFSVPVAILQDLAGPKVRVGTFANGSVALEPGAAFTLTTRPVEGDQQRVSVSYAELPREVRPGSTLLLADGSVELGVEAVDETDIRCRVAVGGTLASRKGVNVPSGLLGLPILGAKDLDDLRFGVARGVDYVGLSFVRTADDVETAKRALADAGAAIPVIAKIETQAALVHIDAILAAADGIMIARGDLSIETPFARVPAVQKELVAKANRSAKPAITATQMLFSMVTSPRPTRAEVADVANAVLDGSDALMLSDETTVGAHPVVAAETMAAIIAATEDASAGWLARPRAADDAVGGPEAVAMAACELAARVDAAVVVTLTMEGRTARWVAKYRPRRPILAATQHAETYRRLALVRGVTPLLLSGPHDDLLDAARAAAREHGWSGADAVIVANDTIRRTAL